MGSCPHRFSPRNFSFSLIHTFSASVILLFFYLSPTAASSIVPGPLWTDTNGNPIQAHGAGFIKHNFTYYWFGEDKGQNNHKFINVKVYKSIDLVQWELAGNALTADSDINSEIGPDAVVERPKVIYNAATKTHVMWFHLDNSGYGLAKLGIATSSVGPEGPYTYYGSISPFGNEDSRDMTVWVDDDGTGYVIYATQVNLNTVIARLTPDYLGIEAKVKVFEGVRWEAYAVFKTKGLYYLITSGTTGWDSNSNHYTYTTSFGNSSAVWAPAKPIAPDSSNTFNCQSNNVIPVGDNQFIFTGDRWNPSLLGDSRYIWLPIEIYPDNSIKISWHSEWWVDSVTGNWGESNSIKYEAESSTSNHVQVSGGARNVSCTGCSGSQAIGYVGAEGNGRITFTNLSVPVTSSYSLVVGYVNGDSAARKASVLVNGVLTTQITFPPTGNGQAMKEIVFETQLLQGQNNSITFFNNESWAPDFDFVRVQCYYSDCRQ